MNRFEALLSDQEQAVQVINNPLFNLNLITENLFEVQSFKKKNVLIYRFKLFFVYGYAKLRTLRILLRLFVGIR